MVRATATPIVPVGGIEPENAASLIASGAQGIAVMGGVMRAAHVGDEISKLLTTITSPSRTR
jgi:thiamine-phosphate pyrophosphorylase